MLNLQALYIESPCWRDERVREALAHVRHPVPRGRIWVTGGFVYRNILATLEGADPFTKDIDVIVEDMRDILPAQSGWEHRTTSYGSRRYRKGATQIDLIVLAEVHSIRRRGLTPHIEHYLSGTPFTIQSITFELGSRELAGHVGLAAIMRRTVGVHNLEQALHTAEKKGRPLHDLVREKAEALRLSPVYANIGPLI